MLNFIYNIEQFGYKYQNWKVLLVTNDKNKRIINNSSDSKKKIVKTCGKLNSHVFYLIEKIGSICEWGK